MNNIVNVEGIILNTKDYNDTSKILDILTKDYGIIGVIAKGCKSLKSNLRSVTDNLTYATFFSLAISIDSTLFPPWYNI